MLATLQDQLALPATTLVLAGVVVLLAGTVRGFAGFGLSALVMASMAMLISPIALIPVCFVLEAVASIVMFRGGLTHGNRPLVLGLTAGYAIGLPVGLSVTHAVSPAGSSLIALVLILTLSLLHLLGAAPPVSRTRWHSPIAGILAGMCTGLASVGGMVVALYMLSTVIAAREVRGSLVLFLMLNMLVTGFWLIVSGTLDMLALKRGLALAPLVVLGVLMGTALFRPSLEPYYKRFCLYLLLGLAALGIIRMLLQ